ncbi:hypothetical protein FACS18949_12770 [Clostridia bacterium]|nr:hypothetical protein FACS18949_12770 [Clostridia bacterium]
MTIQEINKALTIKRLDWEKFSNGTITYACKGYALHVDGEGYIAFTTDATPEGIILPQT